jgi:hypothetical protein
MEALFDVYPTDRAIYNLPDSRENTLFIHKLKITAIKQKTDATIEQLDAQIKETADILKSIKDEAAARKKEHINSIVSDLKNTYDELTNFTDKPKVLYIESGDEPYDISISVIKSFGPTIEEVCATVPNIKTARILTETLDATYWLKTAQDSAG